VKVANSATEPDTSQRRNSSGRELRGNRKAGSRGTPPEPSERRIVRRDIERAAAPEPVAAPASAVPGQADGAAEGAAVADGGPGAAEDASAEAPAEEAMPWLEAMEEAGDDDPEEWRAPPIGLRDPRRAAGEEGE